MSNKDVYLASSYAASKDVAQRFSTSFSMGIFFLGKSIRSPVYAIYGLVRIADEIVDTYFEIDQKVEISNFEKLTREAVDNNYSSNLILNSFQDTVNTYNIDYELINSFFSSMKTDLEKKDHNEDSYSQYIYGSAEVVGLMCLHVFLTGNRKKYIELKKSAKGLGSAFQKVNFLRDFHEDFYLKGRAYFPELKNKNTLSDDIKDSIIANIEKDFNEAKKGIPYLPLSSRIGVNLAFYYFNSLFLRLKKSSSAQIIDNRIRVNNFKKIYLIFPAIVNAIFNKKINHING